MESSTAMHVVGAIDLYVHALPDVVPRRWTDIELATALAEAGLVGAVHRHHFESTAVRATAAAASTGFRLLGAIELSGAAGGLDAAVVARAVADGAAWVSLPTLSARCFQNTMMGPAAGMPAAAVERWAHAGSSVAVVDDHGNAVAALQPIFEIVREAGVILSLGYCSSEEASVLARAASTSGVQRIVLSNPVAPWTRMGVDDAERVMADVPELWLEFSVGLVAGFGSLPGLPAWSEVASLIRAVGSDRVVLSSNGGAAGGPTPAELLHGGCEALLAEGFSDTDVHSLVRDNPARLLGVR